jgi:hypothetical protein
MINTGSAGPMLLGTFDAKLKAGLVLPQFAM